MAWLTFAEIGWEWDRVCYDPVRPINPISNKIQNGKRHSGTGLPWSTEKKMAAKMERVTESCHSASNCAL